MAEKIGNMMFITPHQLNEAHEEVVILDIRNPAAFARNHVPGSINIDVYSDLKLGHIKSAKKKFSVLPKGKLIITVCNAGITAQPAAQVLESMGYKALVLEDGMIGWNARSH